MSTRISSALAAAAMLAACGGPPDPAPIAKAETEAKSAAVDAGWIDCAPAGQADLATRCTVEQVRTAQGLVLVVRQPDGGFHRLLVTRDGRGVVAADGADRALVTVVAPGRIEVAIGGARYRLPATIAPAAAP